MKPREQTTTVPHHCWISLNQEVLWETSRHCWRTSAEIHSSSYFPIWLVVSGRFKSSGENKWLNIKIFHRAMSRFSFSEMLKLQEKKKSIADKQQFSFMDVYNDAFWRWKELKCQSGCFSAPPGGPPRELWLWGIGVGMGRDWRGNGQLQLNVTFIGPSVGFIPSRLDRSRPSGLTFRGCTFHARHRAVKAAKEVSWQAKPGRARSGPGRQQDGVWYATLIHGNAAALPLWLLLHWANTPNCSLPAGPFLSSSTLFMASHFFHGAGEGGSLREPLSKQWRKEAAIFTLFPGEPAFLFFYLSSKLSNWAQSLMSESWINSFKPKGAGHPSPNRPWNVLLEIIKAFPRQHRQILGNQEPPALLSLLYWWFKVSQTKRSCLTWCHLLIWWIMSRWFCSFQRGSGTRKKTQIHSLNALKIKVYFII